MTLSKEHRANIEAAIKETEYKYFGMYEFTEAQHDAVDLLVSVAQAVLDDDAQSASIADTAGANVSMNLAVRYGIGTMPVLPGSWAAIIPENERIREFARAILSAHPAPRMWIETGDFGSDEPPRLVVDAAPPAPSVADAAGASEPLPENINWTRVMALAEKHGDGWSEAKGWSFHCDDDLFNFAGDLAKESGND